MASSKSIVLGPRKTHKGVIEMTKVALDQTTTELTPEILAKAFWYMDADQQAEFFHCLSEVIDNDGESTTADASMQWLYMANSIKKRGRKAEDMFMDVSAHAFDYWPQKAIL